MASAFNISSVDFSVEGIIGSAIVLASYICFVFPLSFYVLYLGFLQWKSKRTDASWFVGHSDFLTCNLALMEFLGYPGFVLVLHGKLSKDGYVYVVGSIVNKLPWFGQLLFPIFTCVEHYLAVVHPMVYLNLKGVKGLWIRNVGTATVWLLSVSAMCYVYVFMHSNAALLLMTASQMCVSLVAIAFCCVSVLRVLLQPKPGDQNKSKFDKTKKRAVCVIVAIMSTLLLRCGANIVLCAMGFYSHLLFQIVSPLMFLLNLSSSVVFLLLYLQRAGKLPHLKRFSFS